MSIKKKIVVGYIVLIFVPVVLFGYYYYNQIYGSITAQFVESRQKILGQAYANLQADLIRIQSIHRLLQYNPNVTDYLEGDYSTDAESIYAYTRYINPVIGQSLFNNPEIVAMRIYKFKPHVLAITDRFVELSSATGDVRDISAALIAGEGKWVIPQSKAAEPLLAYYQNIYNPNITEKLGVLEVKLNGELFARFLAAAGVEGEWSAYLIDSATGQADGLDPRHLALIDPSQPSGYFINRHTIINYLAIDELGVTVALTGNVEDVFRTVKSEERLMILTVFALLVALSFLYYVLASTITKRILRLARHMRQLGDDNMKRIENGSDARDEIGFLMTTYNAMIDRMEELLHNANRAELRNKEAAYQVLQAQIKPHFLYNTLETIRMLAESNNDKEVADISFWFGKLMRYSLSSQQDDTVLSKELETAAFYLNIHKMRLQDRLTYGIEVRMETDSLACPRFILQPLVENSVVHGAAALLRPVHIQIEVTETDDSVCISVSDNGPGIPQARLTAICERLEGMAQWTPGDGEGGLGIYNVSERIQSYYRGESRLELTSDEGAGTRLAILIDKKGAATQ
ncbi:sensor histidine kinase [Paenibacillus sp. 598K]|uniref:sensor histidine kinase n=1 Tax=Paenibacillus sp. 598K TaxID=1117987 RepID=UPI000FFA7E7C|nr:sensor histidine kinase [Paenibacillus sp. 598K]GBF73482.1 sensor histidine kinase [Paenibacillus sp. 598K]